MGKGKQLKIYLADGTVTGFRRAELNAILESGSLPQSGF
jgi:hypothetical protein